MHQRNDGVVAFGHRLFERMVLEPGHVTLDERLAGNHFIALALQDVRKQHRRALSRIVDICLKAHTEHRNLRSRLHVPADPLGHPFGLPVVDRPSLVDERRNVLELFMDEPRVDRDAVSAHTHARRVHIHARMAVRELDEIEHIDTKPVADLAELICIGDVDIAERIFRQLAHFCR